MARLRAASHWFGQQSSARRKGFAHKYGDDDIEKAKLCDIQDREIAVHGEKGTVDRHTNLHVRTKVKSKPHSANGVHEAVVEAFDEPHVQRRRRLIRKFRGRVGRLDAGVG